MVNTVERQNDDGSLIDAHGITLRFGDRLALDKVDISLRQNEITTVIGLNGSGKTSLLRVLLGLTECQAGEIWRKPGLRIGYAPQNVAIDPTLPVTVSRFLGLGQRISAADIDHVLNEVGASAVKHRQMSLLSGGELSRVLLARALVGDPELLALDEPTSGVDVASQAELYDLIARIRDRRGCGVLLISHDLHLVMAATQTVLCLNRHVCCTGHPEAVVNDPAFVDLFGPQASSTIGLYRHHHDHRHDEAGHIVPITSPAEPPAS
jgi:zinc transport system ATP-binding protein